MTSREEARGQVLDLLGDMSNRLNIELALDEAATREEPWCWVFFYNSRAYIATGTFSHALTGNGPIVVERATGRLHELTAARPLEEQLEQLQQQVEAGGG